MQPIEVEESVENGGCYWMVLRRSPISEPCGEYSDGHSREDDEQKGDIHGDCVEKGN